MMPQFSMRSTFVFQCRNVSLMRNSTWTCCYLLLLYYLRKRFGKEATRVGRGEELGLKKEEKSESVSKEEKIEKIVEQPATS